MTRCQPPLFGWKLQRPRGLCRRYNPARTCTCVSCTAASDYQDPVQCLDKDTPPSFKNGSCLRETQEEKVFWLIQFQGDFCEPSLHTF